MQQHLVNNVAFYTFHSFDRLGGIRHCFSTRIGGVSEGCFHSLNLGFGRGDDNANVRENYRRLGDAAGFSCEDIVFSDQVHETRVVPVGAAHRGNGFSKPKDEALLRVDGLMTHDKHVVLTTFYADCVPLYFYDSIKHVIALSHAGWKGTLGEIGRITVEAMAREYGSQPQDIWAGIGPSIGPESFEVDRPVADAFAHGLPHSKPFIHAHENVEGKYFIDLWGINGETLLLAGLLPEHIETAGLCTKQNPGIFFSHRHSGAARGSLAAFLALLP